MLFLSKETMTTRNIDIELLKKDLASIQKGITNIEKELAEIKGEKVSKDEFLPVQKIVYGFTSLILVSVVTALIALVVKR
jgi:tetrahydromethanopterin S-methyltransferase subunit G